MEALTNKENAPEGGIKMKICFIIFGIGSLLAWNAILSDISFFMNYQSDYDPSTSFSFCNFVFNIAFQLIMIWRKQLLSYKRQLIIGLIASMISLVILPLVVISFEKNSLSGFIVTAIIILFQGFVNAFCSSGFFGLTAFFPKEMIISLSTGQGISGVLMNLIGYIVLASVNTGDNDKDAEIGAIIYFSISGLILLLTLLALLYSFKTEYFRFYLEGTQEYNSNIIENVKEIENERITKDSTASQNSDEKLVEIKPSEEGKKEITFLLLFKRLYEIDLLSCYIYVITFALFPSVSISQRLFKFGKYRQITIITIYNIGDTFGRSVISKCRFTLNLAYIIVCSRSLLVVTLILNFYLDMKLGIDPNLSSSLLLINVLALAITNGIATSVCLGLAPTKVPGYMKGRSGSSISFFNILGIFLGTCLAFLTKFIMNQIGVYEEKN